MGTSVSLVGGGLTIAGGILTVATAGVATPVLIAGGHSKYLFSQCLLASDVTFLTQVFWPAAALFADSLINGMENFCAPLNYFIMNEKF